ncbi:hypothetical protein [Pseudalkalibacillus sp. SCS-8]|uniref:ComEC/Rec2 family competence protein n=1 Tax=Pseudalkalibacillus nanhaiensis TaxID=3115291 RepID=UPI0032DAA490
MYAKPLIVFFLFLLMLLFSAIPVSDEPVFFMTEESKGNAIKELDLNLKADDIAISFLELDSGEAALIQDEKGHHVLLNTGSSTSLSQFKHQLKIFNVKKIDALIITNAGKQYTGNLGWLVDEMEVGSIHTSELIADELMKEFELSRNKIKPLKQGDEWTVFHKLNVRLLTVETRSEYNEGGLVLLMEYGTHRFLYMGVSNMEIDRSLIQKGPLDISLLKIGGFGHYFGTSEELLNHIEPEVAVLFKRKGYIASDEVIDRLDEHWIEVLKPFEEGIVMVKWNKTAYEITQVPLFKPEMAYSAKN